MTEEHKAPVAGWTAGQKVFEVASRAHWGGYPGRALTVDRVTPSGRAVIGTTQYDATGRKLGTSRYNGSNIVPFTDKHQAALDLWNQRREAEDMAVKVMWRSLDADQLAIALPALKALTATGEQS